MASNYFESGLKTSFSNKNRPKERELLQEYLLKIIEREKQTEQLSFTLLHSVENMEQKINTMSIYLEKMQILQDHLFNQPTKQLEPEKDLYKVQAMGGSFSTFSHIRENQFPYVSDFLSSDNYKDDYQIRSGLIQNEFPSSRLNLEHPHEVHNPMEQRLEASLRTEPKFIGSFQHQNTSDQPIFPANVQSTLGLVEQNRSQAIREGMLASNTPNSVHPEYFAENTPQKEQSYAILDERRHSVYPMLPPKKHSQLAINTSITQKGSLDPQHSTHSLYTQPTNKTNGIPFTQHDFSDRYGSTKPAANLDQNSNANFLVKNYNQVSEPAPPFESRTVENESVVTNMSKVPPIPKSINNQIYEIHRNNSNVEEGGILKKSKEAMQESGDTISLEQNQNWSNDTNVLSQNQTEESVVSHHANKMKTSVYLSDSPVRKDGILESKISVLNVRRNSQGKDSVENAQNNIVKSDAVGRADNVEDEISYGTEATDHVETKTGNGTKAADNVETKTGNGAKAADNVEIKTGNGTKAADNVETKTGNGAKAADNVETKTGNGKKAADNVEIKTGNGTNAADGEEPEVIDDIETGVANMVESEMADDVETKVAGNMETEMLNPVEKGVPKRRESEIAKDETADGMKTEASGKVKVETTTGMEASHANRKSSVPTEDQEIKPSAQAISSKIVSPAESRKKTKILKKAKTRKESVLARRSSLLLSEESSESGGSIFDKGLSLTSSAAYKSLIGAAPITQENRKPETSAESESEDDMERALNMAMQKASTETKEDASPKKTKPPPKQETMAERKTSIAQSRKPSIYPIPTQKMKLTKASRLALGLDSESDGAPVQSSIKKQVEEESDEFDFFS